MESPPARAGAKAHLWSGLFMAALFLCLPLGARAALCPVVKTVCFLGCDATSIASGPGSALSLIPNPVTQYSCVVVKDTTTVYIEQVQVSGFDTSVASITIMVDPSLGKNAKIDPPTFATAAFQLLNSNVNVFGFDVRTDSFPTYGINVQAANVHVSSVNVFDAIGNLGVSAINFGASASASVVSYATATVAAGRAMGATFQGGVSNALLNSYVQASTGVFLSGSTGTVIGGNTVVSGVPGIGIRLDPGNGGTLVVSTNLVTGAQVGVWVTTPAAGASVWVVANTVVPIIGGFTVGIDLQGLTNGATVQNNGIYYRAPGSTGGFGAAIGIGVVNSTGIVVDHNRINNPDMVTGGNYYGAYFQNSPGAVFKFNDVNTVATSALGFGVGLTFNSGSSSGVVKNNVFSSSMAAAAFSSTATIWVDATSTAGFVSNYNDFFSSNSVNTAQWGAIPGGFRCVLPNWVGAGCPSQDSNSIAANPLWANTAAGAEDFHPLSNVARYDPLDGLMDKIDGVQSPTIDAGDPAENVTVDLGLGLEPQPNGFLANLGSYGRTSQASESRGGATQCSVVRRVCAAGCDASTISGGVASVPNPLQGYSCVIVEDNRTYSEQVTVQGFTMNGSSLSVFTTPALPSYAVVNPPAGSLAAFRILNSSVSVRYFTVQSTNAVNYGINAVAPYVTVSSVNVFDPNGNITRAGVSISSWSLVSGSSLSVRAATALALYFNGAAASTATGSFIFNGTGDALDFDFGATRNLVIQSTIASNTNTTGINAAYFGISSYNTISQSVIQNPLGDGALFDVGSTSNTITQSTISTNADGYSALYLTGASYNTINQSYVTNPLGDVAVLNTNANSNLIVGSTFTTNSGQAALTLFQASSNTVLGSFLQNLGGDAVDIDTGANLNTITQSTVASVMASSAAISITLASSNTISFCYVSNPNGDAIDLLAGANANTITRSTVTSSAANFSALFAGYAVSNTISQSMISSVNGDGVVLDTGANVNTITQSTVTTNSVTFEALYLVDNSSNSVAFSYFFNPASDAVFVDSAANANNFSQTTIVSAGSGFRALDLFNNSGNSFAQSFIVNAQGGAAYFDVGTIGAVISQSTVTSGGSGIPGAATLVGASSNSLLGCYIQGSNAVYIRGSTATLIGGSVLVSTVSGGNALYVGQGSLNLSVSSSTLYAGPGGAGAYADVGNSGLLLFSTDAVLGGAAGVFVATQAAGTAVWITSSTILPVASPSFDTYGIYLNGLMTGATVQNNGILYRTLASAGAFVTRGFYAQSSSGLNVDHNRISNPDKVSAGVFRAAGFSGASNVSFKFNDVFSSNTVNALGSSILLRLANGSTVQAKDNIFVASMSVTGSSATFYVDPTSVLLADFNDTFSSNPFNSALCSNVSVPIGSSWSCNGTTEDANSIHANPLWPSVAAGVEEFHPMSRTGRFDPADGLMDIQDGLESPTIDKGDPLENVGVDLGLGLEPSPNGFIANQGSYGRTSQASESVGPAQNCSFIKTVCAVGCDATTIQAGVNLYLQPPFNGTLSGYSCVLVNDTRSYGEVTVQGFTMNGSSLTIVTNPALGANAAIVPSALAVSGFQLLNSSVNVFAFDIRPVSALSYGVNAVGAYTMISSVNVQDAGGKITAAGISVSSWSAVSYSSVTVANAGASGIQLVGALRTVVSYSSAAASGGTAALYLNGGSSNTVSGSYFSDAAGHGAYLNNANSNVVSLSTVTANSASFFGLYLNGASSNTVAQSYVANPLGNVTELVGGSNFNTVNQDTMTGPFAFFINSSSNNLMTGDFIMNSQRGVRFDSNANNNTLSQSTVVVNSGLNAVYFSGGSSNTVSLCYLANSGGDAVQLDPGSNYNTISLSYVQGSSAVYVAGSSGTVIGGSVLVATNTFGAGLWMAGGAAGLSLSSNVATGGSQGAAVYLDVNGGGPLYISTNTLKGGQFALYVATQTAGTQLWIASNTVLPVLATAFPTYGIYLNGLTSGATIENNGIYYRTPGPAAGRYSYGLYAVSAGGLVVDHNRFNQPAMLTGSPAGSHIGATFRATPNTVFKFNDLNSASGAGAPMFDAFLLTLQWGSTNATVKDNVFASSVTVTDSSATIYVDQASQAGFASNYNDFFSSVAVNTSWWGTSPIVNCAMPNWTGAGCPSQDANSIAANPLWFNTAASAEDFHPQSSAGRFHPGTGLFTPVDAQTSVTIDAGDPAEGTGQEPSPNGGLANQGSYGLTAEASMTPIYGGCAQIKTVCAAGCSATTIGGALGLIPNPLTGYSCVVVRDLRTYNEQVTIQNFTMNGSSLTVMTDPVLGLHAALNPPASSTAAFQVLNSSVNLFNFDVQPGNALTYGVVASSAYVTISSVNVQDAGGKIATAGISISSWSAVSYSSVTVGNASANGFLLPGSIMTTVSLSSAVASGASAAALYLNAASFNTFFGNNFSNASGGGYAAYLTVNSSSNTISQSTISASGVGIALFLNGASSNIIAQDYIAQPGGGNPTVQVSNFAAYNAFSLDTVVGNFLLFQASSNTISTSLVSVSGLSLGSGSNYNRVSQTTATVNGALAHALSINAASYNTVVQSYFFNPSGNGALLFTDADYNILIQSTFTGTAASPGLQITTSSSNTVSNCYIQGSSAVYISASTGTVIGGSVLVATNTFGAGLVLTGGGVNLSLSSSVVTGGAQGAAAYLDQGNGGLISLSTNTFQGAQYAVFVATTNPGTAVWVTSSTILPTISNSFNTYGIYLNGLATGATIQNNNVYYRTSGSAAGQTAYGFYAQSSNGVNFDHNRISNPNMVTAGSFNAAYLAGATNVAFKFNDLLSTNTANALTQSYLLRLADGSTGVQAKDNIFFASMSVTVGGSSATIILDASSSLLSDFNDLFSSNSFNAAICNNVSTSLASSWTCGGNTEDANSIRANPLWAGRGVGIEDFHPYSTIARYDTFDGLMDISDGAQSPTIDKGDPAESVVVDLGLGLEPQPNGSRANQGSYGRTAQASESFTPKNPVVSAVFYSSITVTYGSIPGINGYEVDASTLSDFSSNVFSSATTNTALLALSPQGLSVNTTYYLRAGVIIGNTTNYALTTPASTSTLANPPTGAAVQSVTASTATFSWGPNSNPSPGTLYLALVSTAPNPLAPGGAVVSASATYNTSLSSSGLNGNTTYYFTVQAVNNNGIGTNFTAVIATSTLANVPGPTSVQAVYLSSITFAWGANGNGPGTLYQALVSTAPNPSAPAGAVVTTSSTYNNFLSTAGLSIDTTYYFQVQAISNSGVPSGFTAALGTQTLAGLPSVSVGLVTTSSIQFLWTSGGNPPGTLFQALVSSAANPSAPAGAVVTTSNTYNTFLSTTGLLANTSYFIQVQSINGVGAGSGFTLPLGTSTLSNPPSGPAATAVYVSSIVYSWGANGNPAGTLYAAQVSSYPAFVPLTGSSLTLNASATFFGLGSNTTYYFQVKSINRNGASSAFVPAAATATVVAVPLSSAATNVTPNSFTANWGADGNSTGTLYVLLVSTDPNPASPAPGAVVTSSQTYSTSLSSSGLRANTTYYSAVQAIGFNGLATPFVSLPAINTTVILPPSGLTATSLPPLRILLAWTASVSTGVAGYLIYYDSGTGTVNYGAPYAVVGASVTTYTTPALTNGVTYKFGIRAQNAQGGNDGNTNVQASAVALQSFTGLIAQISSPPGGRRLQGNRVTVAATLVNGQIASVKQIDFQFRFSSGSVWMDIVAAEPNHPNPATTFPYFVHWDISSLVPANYDLRAVGTDVKGVTDPSPPTVTVTVDPSAMDVNEYSLGGGEVEKDQVAYAAAVNSIEVGDGASNALATVVIPAAALSQSSLTATAIMNPPGVPAAPTGWVSIGDAIQVTLSNGQTALLNGQTAQLVFSYPDSKGDGIIDGTTVRADRLAIYYYDPVSAAWRKDFASSMDSTRRTISGSTPHFSLFALLAASASDLSSVRVYPVPYKPNGSNPDEGRPFSALDPNSGIVFDNLPDSVSLKVFTVTGELVRSISTDSSLGRLQWDAKNDRGKDVASGLYMAVISSPGNGNVVRKILIVR